MVEISVILITFFLPVIYLFFYCMYVFFIIMFYCVYGQMSEIKNYYYYYYYYYGFLFNELIAQELIDRLLTHLNDFKILINLYMDLSKAFDHIILLHKLTYYVFKIFTNALLRSYISNRTQYVQIDKISESMLSINTGVPQGSSMGPILFNIFSNDIVMSSNKFNIILYADDTTLNVTVESFGETVADIQLFNQK